VASSGASKSRSSARWTAARKSLSGQAAARRGDGCACSADRGRGRFVAQSQCPGQQLLRSLVAGGQADLAQQATLMASSLRSFIKLERAAERVGRLRQAPCRFLNFCDMVKRLGSVHPLAGGCQRFRLAEQGTFVMRRAGHGCRILDEGFLQMTEPEQNTTQARVGKSARRSDRGSGSIGLESLLESPSEDGYVAEPE
jgi:hypothetical protein